ncbi:unnamed protein product [Spirodela intermedia]|uniref:Uncharacterized protein n=1 Tax=Spirodela intermedia TaxID=51605 RepID=A0A7I8LGV6_SPIIN|nr:unnamed protein product [Spirodela intermedia]
MERNDPLKRSRGKLILEVKNRLKDLHNLTEVHPVGVHGLHSEPQETSRGDACEWLDIARLNALKDPCDDVLVELRPCRI